MGEKKSENKCRCEDCGNEFEKRYVYIDNNGTCICKYCYEGYYETDDNGNIVERQDI